MVSGRCMVCEGARCFLLGPWSCKMPGHLLPVLQSLGLIGFYQLVMSKMASSGPRALRFGERVTCQQAHKAGADAP